MQAPMPYAEAPMFRPPIVQAPGPILPEDFPYPELHCPDMIGMKDPGMRAGCRQNRARPPRARVLASLCNTHRAHCKDNKMGSTSTSPTRESRPPRKDGIPHNRTGDIPDMDAGMNGSKDGRTSNVDEKMNRTDDRMKPTGDKTNGHCNVQRMPRASPHAHGKSLRPCLHRALPSYGRQKAPSNIRSGPQER